MKTAMFWSGA